MQVICLCDENVRDMKDQRFDQIHTVTLKGIAEAERGCIFQVHVYIFFHVILFLNYRVVEFVSFFSFVLRLGCKVYAKRCKKFDAFSKK